MGPVQNELEQNQIKVKMEFLYAIPVHLFEDELPRNFTHKFVTVTYVDYFDDVRKIEKESFF